MIEVWTIGRGKDMKVILIWGVTNPASSVPSLRTVTGFWLASNWAAISSMHAIREGVIPWLGARIVLLKMGALALIVYPLQLRGVDLYTENDTGMVFQNHVKHVQRSPY
jgi:hypothetical protein